MGAPDGGQLDYGSTEGIRRVSGCENDGSPFKGAGTGGRVQSTVWGYRAQPQTHSLPVRAQPLLCMQHVVYASAIALQQVLPPLLPSPWALAGREGQILPAAFLTLQDPVRQKEAR